MRIVFPDNKLPGFLFIRFYSFIIAAGQYGSVIVQDPKSPVSNQNEKHNLICLE